MKCMFKRTVTCLLAQSVLIFSLPLTALAAPDNTSTIGFDMPINDQLIDNTIQDHTYISVSIPETDETVDTNAVPAGSNTQSTAFQTTSASPVEIASLTGIIETNVIDEDVIIIDSDLDKPEFKAQEAWQDIKDEPGLTKLSAGMRFPVVVVSSLSSKTNRVGDPVEARLLKDITIGGRLIAKKGDPVVGHIATCHPARRMLHAELSPKRWMRANGALGLQFDEIITANNEHLPLLAKPAQQSRIVKNLYEGRVMGVNHKGEIAGPLGTQLKHQAAHLAIRAAASAGGVFSFGIVPVAYGVIGAINPNFAFLHVVGKNVRHRRLKGFAMGVTSGLPGGFLIADTIIRGTEAQVKPGDQFLAEFHQDFTGEASTSASLIPGASAKVRGEVVKPNKKKN